MKHNSILSDRKINIAKLKGISMHKTVQNLIALMHTIVEKSRKNIFILAYILLLLHSSIIQRIIFSHLWAIDFENILLINKWPEFTLRFALQNHVRGA